MARLAATEVNRYASSVVLKIKQRMTAAGHVRVRRDDAFGGENRLCVGRLTIVVQQRA